MNSTLFKCARLGAVSVIAMTLPWSCVGEEPQMTQPALAAPAIKAVAHELPAGASDQPQAPFAPKIVPKDRAHDGHACAPRRLAKCCRDNGFDDDPKAWSHRR